MAYTKRLCWALIVFSIITLLPLKGWCIKLDPYQFHVIRGTLSLEYEREVENREDSKDTTSSFLQIYTISLLGNILTPQLIVYDAAIEYHRENSYSDADNTNTDGMNYSLSTTFLRNSRIPLTLFGNRYTSNFNSEFSNDSTTGNLYGFDWSGKFVRLPKIHLRGTREDTESDGSNSHRTDYYLDIEKKLGPTDNSLSYSDTSTTDSSAQTTSTSVINFRNRTPLTTHTIISIGATRGENVDISGPPSTTYGLSLNVTSDPSRFFNQAHDFIYYNFDTVDQVSDGSIYTGSLNYRISKKIETSISLSVNNSHTESVTSTEDSRDTSGSISITYNVTKRLYLSESAIYQHSESTSSTDTESNLTDRNYITARSTVGYNRRLSWAVVSGSYGLGYVEDTDTVGGGGKGIEQAFTAALNQIDFNKYLLFNLSAADSRIKNTEGAVHGRVQNFHFNTYNKKWKKYVTFNGYFDKTSSKSWSSALEERTQDFGFSAGTNFIRSTAFSTSFTDSKSFSDLSGFGHAITESFSASHQRIFLRGRLSISLNFQNTDSTFTGGTSSTRNATYSLRYAKSLLRRIGWNFLIQRSEIDTDESSSDTTLFRNTLTYSLRAWQFYFNHTYSILHSSTDNNTFNRILFRASRSFTRIF